MNNSLIINKNIIHFANNISSDQTSKISIINHTNDDFIYKFLVKDNKLCHISPPNGIIEKNNSKEIKINITPDAINNINKIIIHAINIKYINIKETTDIWTIYKHLIEKYTIDIQYNKQNNSSCKFFTYLYIIIFILIVMFLIGVYYYF